MIRHTLISLSLFALIPAHAENLLGRDTDDFPGEFQLRLTNGQATSTGRLPAPWAAVHNERRTNSGEIVFGPDPVHQRPSFGITNLSAQTELSLATLPPINLTRGTEYELAFE